MFRDTTLRSVIKAVSYRVAGSGATAGLVWFLAGETRLALVVGGIDGAMKIAIYFFHERIWNRIRFGRRQIKPFVLWITGLSGSGKSALAKELAARLESLGFRAEHLDGENIRRLFPATGFSRAEVNLHIERVGYLASKLERNGVFVVASFISPHAESRDFVRRLCSNFVLIHLTPPLEVCQRRDPSGLYAKAQRGEVTMVAGLDAPYEVPSDADVVIDTSTCTVDNAAGLILEYLKPNL